MNLIATPRFVPPELSLPTDFGSGVACVPDFLPWAMPLNLSEIDGAWFRMAFTPNAPSAITGVTVEADDEIATKSNHGLETGDPVVASGLTGGVGLSNGTTYYVIKTSANGFKLAASLDNAVSGTAINVTTDYTAATFTPLESRVRIFPLSGTVSGGALVGFAGGTNTINDLTGFQYLCLQEYLVTAGVATTDHAVSLRYDDGTLVRKTVLGTSSHLAAAGVANAVPALIECRYPKPFTAAFSADEYLEVALPAANVANVGFQLTGLMKRT